MEKKEVSKTRKKTRKKWTVGVRFLNYGRPTGSLYRYKSFIPMKEGDVVVVQVNDSYGIAEVELVEKGFCSTMATKFVVHKVDTAESDKLTAEAEELQKLEDQIRERVEIAKEEAVIRALAKDDPELASLYERYKQIKE